MYIAIDVGGTNIRVANYKDLDKPVTDQVVRLQNGQNYDVIISKTAEAIRQFVDTSDVEAIGVGMPGTIDEAKGELISAKNLRNWSGKSIKEDVARLTGVPAEKITVKNDALAAALGEAYFGGDHREDFHYIVWGTGIGGAAASVLNEDGQFQAHKLNWQQCFKDWELACGGASIARRFEKSPEALTNDDWQEVYDTFKSYLLEYIQRQSPQTIVFGGGLALRHTGFIAQLGEEIPNVRLSVTKFGDDSGLIGALALVKPVS